MIFIRPKDPADGPIAAELTSGERQQMANYFWADRTYDAENHSFQLHWSKYVSCADCAYQPDAGALVKALRKTICLMKPALTRLPADFLSRTHFDRVLTTLEFKSSPGFPWCHTYPTIGALLGYNAADNSFNAARAEVLWRDVVNYLEGRRAAYPIRVFVKGEPVKKAKKEEGRYRLIAAPSVTDTIVDNLLHSGQNQREIEMVHELPVAPGWSAAHGGWKLIETWGEGYDRTAWDYSVPLWLLETELKMREQLCVNVNSDWQALARRRFNDLYRDPLFQLSDGSRYRQRVGGVMKSGCVNTIATNSHCQLLLHSYVVSKLGHPFGGYFFAMGDDTIQTPVRSGYTDYLKRIVRLKPVTVGEFCSTKFEADGRVEPQNVGRHLKLLAACPPRDLHTTLLSYQINYARSSWLPRLREIVLAVSPSSYLTDVELATVMDT